jgi:hypothetical protein
VLRTDAAVSLFPVFALFRVDSQLLSGFPYLRASVVKILFRTSVVKTFPSRALTQFFHQLAQLNYLQPLRTIRPIMLPAHNRMASSGIMTMRFEIPAVDFQLNKHQLHSPGTTSNRDFKLDNKANKW